MCIIFHFIYLFILFQSHIYLCLIVHTVCFECGTSIMLQQTKVIILQHSEPYISNSFRVILPWSPARSCAAVSSLLLYIDLIMILLRETWYHLCFWPSQYCDKVGLLLKLELAFLMICLNSKLTVSQCIRLCFVLQKLFLKLMSICPFAQSVSWTTAFFANTKERKLASPN